MGLCIHGYTAMYDCPNCECPGCGRTQDQCVCHQDPKPEYRGAAGPVAQPELDCGIMCNTPDQCAEHGCWQNPVVQ